MAAPADGRILRKAKVKSKRQKRRGRKASLSSTVDDERRAVSLPLLPFAFLLLRSVDALPHGQAFAVLA
jgi:hypothetical protein